MKMSRVSEAGGFTLVELLVVIAIIAVLISILLPVVAKVRQAAVNVQCKSNMRQIGIAINQYAADNADTYPWAECNYALPGYSQVYITWDDLINQQLGGKMSDADVYAPYAPHFMPVLHCPADETERQAPWYQPATGPLYPRSYAITRVFGTNPQHPVSFLGIGGQDGGPPASARISIRRSWVMHPADTLLLVEKPDYTNIQGWIGLTGLADGPVYQMSAWRWPPELFHDKSNHGKTWNYLFCDGHVEPLTLEDTVRTHGSSWYSTVNNIPADYMWTINPND
jgi:prepilin-type N-terminal cleavage/methylation domain-containing protein/prepilin-type processing-associated H-X9-DG protein